MSVPLLLVKRDGGILNMSTAAMRLLGSPDLRTCCDLVRARQSDGSPACTARCAAQPGDRDLGAVTIRGRRQRLVCTTLGDVRVVTILPETRELPTLEALSPREREVLALVAEGFTTQIIARRLKIQAATVRTHVENVREKLGARTRAEAVAQALRAGLL